MLRKVEHARCTRLELVSHPSVVSFFLKQKSVFLKAQKRKRTVRLCQKSLTTLYRVLKVCVGLVNKKHKFFFTFILCTAYSSYIHIHRLF